MKRVWIWTLPVWVIGCASTTPTFDAKFGHAAREIFAQQTRDPGASDRNKDRPVDGIDARAGAEAIERYEQSFQKPPAVNNQFVIGVSGGAGGAK